MTSSATNIEARQNASAPSRDARWKPAALRIGALALTTALFTLANAPVGQFYLAWFALVPWIWVVTRARNKRTAFAWGFLGGLLVFTIHLASYFRMMILIPIGMIVVLAASWGIVAAFMHRSARTPIATTLSFAAAWVAVEWLRGRIVSEYPMYFLGHSQSPFHAISQIADLFGVYGISFLVAGVNACIARCAFDSVARRQKMIGATFWLVLLLAVAGYGLVRLNQETQPGPRVMVVQSTLDFGPGGTASLDREAHLNLLLSETRAALEKETGVDLVVWPESVTPPINPEARTELRRGQAGPQLERMHEEIAALAAKHHTGIMLGGYYIGNWQLVNGQRIGTDIRNSAYLYDRAGEQVARYDKIHLVPYGEYIPLREGVPWFGSLLAKVGPWPMDYVLNPGLVTATLPKLDGSSQLRLLPTICFEDNIAPQIATMARPQGESDKRADLIANMSNDGWFSSWYMAQRSQAASFRCIENRLPMARAESGGVSGLIDSCGRTLARLPAWNNGYAVRMLSLDARVTRYQRIGDTFPLACLVLTLGTIVRAISFRRTRPLETAADPRQPDAPRPVARRGVR